MWYRIGLAIRDTNRGITISAANKQQEERRLAGSEVGRSGTHHQSTRDTILLSQMIDTLRATFCKIVIDGR